MNSIRLIQVTIPELEGLLKTVLKAELANITPTSQEGPDVLTRQEVATLFNVSLVCIHDWIKKGILKPYKIGNRTFFKRSEVLEKLYSSNI